jgi:phage I-like protein
VIEGQPGTETSKLTEEERVVCSVMGWSEEEFLDQKKKEA